MWISAHLGSQLDDYVAQHLSGVVRVVRTKRREGLIRARIYGADSATGDVSNCVFCRALLYVLSLLHLLCLSCVLYHVIYFRALCGADTLCLYTDTNCNRQ